MSIVLFDGDNEQWETSSFIPIENFSLGIDDSALSKTLNTSLIVKSFPPKPYLPENIFVLLLEMELFTAATTSKNNGSPILPGSLVRSKTEIVLTVLGINLTNSLALNGRNKWIFINPYIGFILFNELIVISAVSAPDPIITIRCLGVFDPTYMKGW